MYNDETLFDDIVSHGGSLAVKVAKENIEHALDHAVHSGEPAAENPVRHLEDYLFDLDDLKFAVDDTTDGRDGDADYNEDEDEDEEYDEDEEDEETESEEETDLELDTDLENELADLQDDNSDSDTVAEDKYVSDLEFEGTEEEASDSDEEMNEVGAGEERITESVAASMLLESIKKSDAKVLTELEEEL
jgi:hypothetical protein